MNNKYCHTLLGKLFIAALCLLGATAGCNRPSNPPNSAPKPSVDNGGSLSNTTPIEAPNAAAPAPLISPARAPQSERSVPSSSMEWAPHDGRIELVNSVSDWRPGPVHVAALKMPEDSAAKAATEQPKDARNFILRASNDGQALEQAALYVATKSSNSEIRSYAALVGQEQGKANEQLRKLAAKRGIDTPNDPEGVTRHKLDQLRDMEKGVQLDQAFLQQFGIDAQADAIALYEQQARQGDDKELRKYAAKVLPKLRKHYSQANSLQQKNVIKTSKLSM